jgi:hypothetical protein
VSSNGTELHLHSPGLWAQEGTTPLAPLLDPDPPWLADPPLDPDPLPLCEALLDPPPPAVTQTALLQASPALHVPLG